MSPTRKARYTPFGNSARKRTRTVSLPVAGGVHKGVSPQDLPPGFSPELQNFVGSDLGLDGWIQPRQGLDKDVTYDFNGAVLGAQEVFDVNGNSCGFAPSSRSFSFLHPTTALWSDLSYVPGSVVSTSITGNLSGTSTDYFNTASLYDVGTDTFIAVVSNNTDSLKFFTVASTTTTFSDFTWTDSQNSINYAADVAAVNDRLVLFNVRSSDGTTYPTRTMWSARGNPRSFLINDGAGFEDRMDMRGQGKAAVRYRDFLLEFTEFEVWRATPTFDDYAFRFDRVIDSVGCPWPRTIVAVPEGVIFLGRDREVYITDGASVASLGPVGGDGPSRIQRLLQEEAVLPERWWGLYNQERHRYELYYLGKDGSTFPNRALFYDIRARTWWPQKFSVGLSSGAGWTSPGTSTTIDEIGDTIDSLSLTIDSYIATSGEREVNVFDSLGTTYHFHAHQTDDNGTAVDARWRSGGIRAPDHRRMHLTEVWMDYENASNSSATLFVGAARNSNAFDSGTALSLTTQGAPIFTPTWKTGTAPNIEIRLSDGGKPKVSSFHLTLKDASKF